MAVTNRLRSVPPTLWTDEVLLELPRDARLTAAGLRHYVDDHGRASARPALIRSQLYPLDLEVTDEEIEWHLAVLEEAGYLRLYEVRGRQYLEIPEWPSQDRAQPSTVPPPSEPAEVAPPSGSVREPLASPSREAREDLATSSRVPRETLAVVEGRKEEKEEGEQEGRTGGGGPGGVRKETLARLLAMPEPIPFCTKHAETLGTDEKCGPCGGARKKHEAWVKAQIEAQEEAA
jgi:hypothetical protein